MGALRSSENCKLLWTRWKKESCRMKWRMDDGVMLEVGCGCDEMGDGEDGCTNGSEMMGGGQYALYSLFSVC